MTDINTPPSIVFREPQVLDVPDPQDIARERSGSAPPTLGEFKEPTRTPPLSIYKEIKGKPYSAEYFNLGKNWETWNFPKELEAIEMFVTGEIKISNLTDSTEAFKEIITKLENKIGRRENEKTWSRLDRLVSYIRAIENTRKWNLRKTQLEEGSNA